MGDNLGDIDKSQKGSGHSQANNNLRITGDLWSAVIAGAALAVSIFSVLIMWWSNQRNIEAEVLRSKEYKQIQVQLMYSNAILLREGLAKPGDMVFGPEGNLEYVGGYKFKQEQRDGRNSLRDPTQSDPAVR